MAQAMALSDSMSASGPTSLPHTAFQSLDDVLEDLSSRFIVNLPPEEHESMERICFQIEQAHWFYEDFVRPESAIVLPAFSLKNFALTMFRACPLLEDFVPGFEKIWTSFMAYKVRVPVCGAILISESWDKVLLVKGFNKAATWSFPRGKINKNEPESQCAVREVREETGLDMGAYFKSSVSRDTGDGRSSIPQWHDRTIQEQSIRLYFIPNVPDDYPFATTTRKEISKIEWFNVSDLPTWKTKKKAVQPGQPKAAKFYMVAPFVQALRDYIAASGPAASSSKKKKAGRMTQAGAQRPQGYDMAVDSGIDPVSDGLEADDEDESTEDHAPPNAHFKTREEADAALKAFFFGPQYEEEMPPEVDAAAAIPAPPQTQAQPEQVHQQLASPTRHQQSLLDALMGPPPAQRAPPQQAPPQQAPPQQSTPSAAQPNLLDMMFKSAASKSPATAPHSVAPLPALQPPAPHFSAPQPVVAPLPHQQQPPSHFMPLSPNYAVPPPPSLYSPYPPSSQVYPAAQPPAGRPLPTPPSASRPPPQTYSNQQSFPPSNALQRSLPPSRDSPHATPVSDKAALASAQPKPSPRYLMYQRSHDVLQPKPKPSQHQQNLLQALLSGNQSDSMDEGVRRSAASELAKASTPLELPPSAPPQLADLFRSIQRLDDTSSSQGDPFARPSMLSTASFLATADDVLSHVAPSSAQQVDTPGAGPPESAKHEALLRALDELALVSPQSAPSQPPQQPPSAPQVDLLALLNGSSSSKLPQPAYNPAGLMPPSLPLPGDPSPPPAFSHAPGSSSYAPHLR